LSCDTVVANERYAYPFTVNDFAASSQFCSQ
jgi:hypothetical protein